jgi:hypothetical protein
MQELKKKKDNYLSNQGRQNEGAQDPRGTSAINTVKSGSPVPVMVDNTSEQPKY